MTTKNNTRADLSSSNGSEDMAEQRFSSVADFVGSISDDDDSFVDEFNERLQSREVVKTLQTMRIASGKSQAEVADELGCSQGRISKLVKWF